VSLLLVAVLSQLPPSNPSAGQQSSPRANYGLKDYLDSPTYKAKKDLDVANKDGNPPFVYIGVEPVLPENQQPKGPNNPSGSNGTPFPGGLPPTGSTPPGSSPPGSTPGCKTCPCVPKKKYVHVTCQKEIQKKKYVPYYCYYSRHAVITGDRAAYLSKLLFKIRLLRKTNAHFRLVLKQLVLKQKN